MRPRVLGDKHTSYSSGVSSPLLSSVRVSHLICHYPAIYYLVDPACGLEVWRMALYANCIILLRCQ